MLFFLISNVDKETPGPVFTAFPEKNPDRLAHMVAYAVENSPYLLFSFEDQLNTGDADYADAIFAVELSRENIAALLGRYDSWNYIRKTIIRVTLIALILGGPFIATAAYQAVLAYRIRRAKRKIQHFVEVGQIPAALETIENTLTMLPYHRRDDWLTTAIETAQQNEDTAYLLWTYQQNPKLFYKHEKAALQTGNALIETGQVEEYGELRLGWEKLQKQSADWAILDIKALIQLKRTHEAVSRYQRLKLPPAHKAKALAEIALGIAENDPQKAWELLEPIRSNAADAALLYASGIIKEKLGDISAALHYYVASVRSAPKDPYFRVKVADILCRKNKYREALQCLAEGLLPPSSDSLWCRFLFWRQVTIPFPAKIPEPPPPGPRRELIRFLRTLPEDRFWDEPNFDKVAAQFPHVMSMPEVWWLRLLEMIRNKNLIAARSLLSVERYPGPSLCPELEVNLLRIIMYKQTGSLGFDSLDEETRISEHPFFRELDRAAQQGGIVFSNNLLSLLTGDLAFTAACLSVGWNEAAKKLFPKTPQRTPIPDWLKHALSNAGLTDYL